MKNTKETTDKLWIEVAECWDNNLCPSYCQYRVFDPDAQGRPEEFCSVIEAGINPIKCMGV